MKKSKTQPVFKVYYTPTGYGLVKDADILKAAVERLGFTCHIEKIGSASNTPFNMNGYCFYLLKKYNILSLFKQIIRFFTAKTYIYSFHLENIAFKQCFRNENHILIPNQEWFDPQSVDLLRFMDAVWCKSHFAKNIFSELSCKTRHIGFCSTIDDRLNNIKKSREYFFARVGKSKFRGGELLIKLWGQHPEWPQLKIVIDPKQIPANVPANVECIAIFSDQHQFQILAASSLYHIYMTETEGFGHSIYEAMGYGSLVIVTDAPPMNEVLNQQCAILVASQYAGQKLLAPRFNAIESEVERAIEKALSLSDDEIAEFSKNAKNTFNLLHENFIQSLEKTIKEF